LVTALRLSQLPWLKDLPGSFNLRKTTCQGGFFVYREEITRTAAESQEDPKTYKLLTTLKKKIN